MKHILEIFKNPEALHHAYVVEGDLEDNLSAVRNALEDFLGVSISAYPDFFECIRSSFTVADSELFIAKQSNMSFGGGKRFFVLSGETFTPEAQNKLLKVLEEPLTGNHIFLLTPNASILLPTLLSRLLIIRGGNINSGDAKLFCDKFINSSITDKLVLIEKFLKNDDDESSHTRHRAKEIFAELEREYTKMLDGDLTHDAHSAASFLSELLSVRKYLDDPASSVRLIMEFVAFSCPPKL